MTTSVESSSSSYLLGMSLLLMSLVCLGTWPALLRLCSTERTVVVGQTNIVKPPRDNRFAYLDYSLSYVISSSIPLIVSLINDGDIGGGYDGSSSSSSSSSCYHIQLVLVAMIGGTLLSLGNISMQWSTTVFGAPLTTVVAIQASLTVTIGTSINYVLEPTKTPKPIYLLCGVITFVIAILLASKAHLLYGECNNKQQNSNNNNNNNEKIYNNNRSNDPSCIELMEDIHKNNYQSTEETTIMMMVDNYNDYDESSSSYTDEEDIDSCNMSTTRTTEANNRPSSSSSTSMPKKALLVAIFGGCCFGFFSPAFNIAVNNPFANNNNNNNEYDGHEETNNTLSVTVANLWFSFAFAVSSIVFNIILMYRPPIDSGLNKTTIWRYIRGEDLLSDRYLAICAGMVCGIANMLQFKGGSIVGFATSDLVQAYPLISTCWDIYLFHEFAKATLTIRLYIFAMYIMYISGIVCIIASAI